MKGGEHPIAGGRGNVYAPGMKHQHFYRDKNQTPSGPAHAASQGEMNQQHGNGHWHPSAARPVSSADLNQNKMDFEPDAAEVATRAYFSYVNQGSLPGRDVEHWLAAEAQIVEERELTRTHGYPNHK